MVRGVSFNLLPAPVSVVVPEIVFVPARVFVPVMEVVPAETVSPLRNVGVLAKEVVPPNEKNDVQVGVNVIAPFTFTVEPLANSTVEPEP